MATVKRFAQYLGPEMDGKTLIIFRSGDSSHLHGCGLKQFPWRRWRLCASMAWLAREGIMLKSGETGGYAKTPKEAARVPTMEEIAWPAEQ
jgi:hypothetical protein